MGGRGSGRWSRSKKTYVDDCRYIDINRMMKLGAIPKEGWRSGGWSWVDTETGETKSSISYEADTRNHAPYIRFHYTLTDSQQKIDYKVYLSRTEPHYGGDRFWFICPRTGRRVSKLYLQGGVFASRHAYGLTYESQSESPYSRALSKKWKIVRKTEGDNYPERPKGMHHKTFERILDKFEQQDELCSYNLIRRFGYLAGI